MLPRFFGRQTTRFIQLKCARILWDDGHHTWTLINWAFLLQWRTSESGLLGLLLLFRFWQLVCSSREVIGWLFMRWFWPLLVVYSTTRSDNFNTLFWWWRICIPWRLSPANVLLVHTRSRCLRLASLQSLAWWGCLHQAIFKLRHTLLDNQRKKTTKLVFDSILIF